jgi:aerobic-type carbon monoxide dehydrogenase small subunit (CoxS/CutS family)
VNDWSRRAFLETTAAGLVASTVRVTTAEAAQADAIAAPEAATIPSTTIQLRINGRDVEASVEDRTTLAAFLRDHLLLTGTKVACDRGECGACTVLLDGASIYSCSYLAVWAAGRSVGTVEGLASADGRLHPLQEAFIAHDAPQCGFCTSGQLMSAKALLAVNPRPSSDEVRAGLAGNLCRCSNYNHYVEAVLSASSAAHPVAPSAPQPQPGGGEGQ